jgi:Flp pilus assembly protein TadD
MRIRVAAKAAWIAVLAWLVVALAACGGEPQETRVAAQVDGPAASAPGSPPPAESTFTSETEDVQAPEPIEPREVTYDEAETAFTERRYGEAVELFGLYTERKPENPWGHYMLGLSAWKSGELDRAEQAFERALELDPGHVKSLLNLSRVLLEDDRPEEALERIEEARELDAESVTSLRLLGRAYHELDRPDDAIDAYRQAILKDGEDAWSMNNMGLVLIEEGQYEDALLPLARAVEVRDDVAMFQNNLGMALEHAGHYRAAEDEYRQAVASQPSYEKAQENLARIEVVKENPDVEPVDLGELARSFEDEVEGWREALAHRLSLESTPAETLVEVEEIRVEWPDTLETIQKEMSGEAEGGDSGGEGRSGAEGGL